MAIALAKSVIRHEYRPSTEVMSDEDLLEQFLAGEEMDSQEAFRALVERHGPMVLGICRYVLNQDQDAEDAFQATFLVLSRKAGSIRNRRVLAGWLHEIAYRIAIKARASTVRRRTLERQGTAMSGPAIHLDEQGEQAALKELRPVLHEEVNRLPDKYRIPVILSYLEGKTNEEVAEQLRWPVGTVKGRLSRARGLLRSRLTQRGLALSAAFLMTALSRGRVFAEVVPSSLVRRTVRLAVTTANLPHSLDEVSPPDPESPIGDLSEFDIPKPKRGLGFSRARLGIFVSLFFLSFLSIAPGTSLASRSNGGGGLFKSKTLSNLRTVVLTPFASRGSSCH